MLSLQFLGAAGTVTGSKHLLRFSGDKEMLLDCGLFQGAKEWRVRNWDPLPIPSKNIEWLVLTHAHLDHTGFLPRLYATGFRSPNFCTSPTKDLVEIVLPDSGHLQEEEAEFANKKGFTKHKVALPLYTVQQANESLSLLTARPFHEEFPLGSAATAKYLHAGHILGSAMVEVRAEGKKILFSGDVGRGTKPEPVEEADYLVLESTYGNRLHSKDDPRPAISRFLHDAASTGGTVIIPAFAVERTEKMLFLLKELMESGKAPRMPIYIDSPMAVEAVNIFVRHSEEHEADTKALVAKYGDPERWPGVTFCKTRDESVAVNSVTGAHVIISASGMLSGGRVLHHLEHHIGDPRTIVLFVGFQAPGGRGRMMQEGRPTVRLFGHDVAIKCRIETLDQFSDHADYEELLAWLKHFKRPPTRTFLVHGEPAAAASLQERIKDAYGWDVHVAQYLETVNL